MRTILIAAILFCVSQLTQAATVHFNADGSPSFTTSSTVSFMNENTATVVRQGSGYDNVYTATDGPYIAFNAYAADLAIFDWNGPGTFDLNSFVIAGAWGSQTLTIRGYAGEVLTNTAELLVNTAASVFQANWLGLTSFSIATGNDFVLDPNVNGNGQHWALNAITFNEDLSEVPLPAAAWMFLAGIAGVIGIRRKAIRKA